MPLAYIDYITCHWYNQYIFQTIIKYLSGDITMEITLNKERLIECRSKLGITKMEAAKRMNLSQPAYVRYENGNRTPSIQTLNIIYVC